ncbi:MAG: glycosyltransferase family 2 protein [Acidimicrobiales bacterium]
MFRIDEDQDVVAPRTQPCRELSLAATGAADRCAGDEQEPHPRSVSRAADAPSRGPSEPRYGEAVERRSRPPGSPAEAVLVGLLCTFHRPTAVQTLLGALERQTRPPDVLVVVDNGQDVKLEASIAQRPHGPMEVRYLRPPGNLGPAGAFTLGLQSVAAELGAPDLVVHLDDDDPPVDDGQLAALVAELLSAAHGDPSVAGIGLSGGRLNTRTGVVRPVAGAPRLEEVDHLHGGYLPVYRADALLSVDGNDPTFFYGFEELELGRRIHQRGWKLLVDNELMRELVDRYPKRKRDTTARATLRIDEGDLGWSRFHKERNLIRILRRERRWAAIITTVLLRHLGKPLLVVPSQPRAAAGRMLLGMRATIAGLRGCGGIDLRYSPEVPAGD